MTIPLRSPDNRISILRSWIHSLDPYELVTQIAAVSMPHKNSFQRPYLATYVVLTDCARGDHSDPRMGATGSEITPMEVYEVTHVVGDEHPLLMRCLVQ